MVKNIAGLFTPHYLCVLRALFHAEYILSFFIDFSSGGPVVICDNILSVVNYFFQLLFVKSLELFNETLW